jgi:hypothetical protein
MTMRFRLSLTLWVAIILAFMSSQRSIGADEPDGGPPFIGDPSVSISVVLQSDGSTESPTSPLLLKMKMTNTSARLVRYNDAPASAFFLLRVTDANGTVITKNIVEVHIKAFSFEGKTSVLRPGETHFFQGEMSGCLSPLSAFGYRLSKSGTYHIVAYKPFIDGSKISSNEISITVK